MLPVCDVIPPRTAPVATIGLILAGAAAFGYELTLDSVDLQVLASTRGVVPVDFAWGSTITSLALHGGWVHLATNLYFLWLFGPNVEDALGRLPFLLVFFASAAAAAALHAWAHPWSALPLIGASGAVAGVMGVYVVLYPKSRVLTLLYTAVQLDALEVPAVFFVSFWFLLQLLNGVATLELHFVHGAGAFWANLTGLGTGALCGTSARLLTRALSRYWR